MKKFVQKTVVVEAVQFTTNNEPDNREMDSIVKWLVSLGEKARHDGTDIYVENSSRHEVRVSVGDWIVKDKRGLSLPVKSFIFDQTFEPCDHKWEAVDDSEFDECLVCGDTQIHEMQYFGDEVL